MAIAIAKSGAQHDRAFLVHCYWVGAGRGEVRCWEELGSPGRWFGGEPEFMGSADEGNMVRWYTEAPPPATGAWAGGRRTGPAPAQSVLPHA